MQTEKKVIRYSKEFKEKIREEYVTTTITIMQLVEKYELSYHTLYAWIERYRWEKQENLKEPEDSNNEVYIEREKVKGREKKPYVNKEKQKKEELSNVYEVETVNVDENIFKAIPLNPPKFLSDRKQIEDFIQIIIFMLIRGYESEIVVSLKKKYPEYAEDFTVYVVNKLKNIARRRLTRSLTVNGKYIMVEYIERLQHMFREVMREKNYALALKVSMEYARALGIGEDKNFRGDFDIRKFTQEQIDKFQTVQTLYPPEINIDQLETL